MGPSPFSHAIFRAVPSLARGECVNVGVLVYCRPRRFLGVRTQLDERRLRALAPGFDSPELQPHLRALERIAAGDRGAGPIAALELDQRFHWLVAPSSTVVQPSEVHTGVCDDPAAELERLFRELVVPPRAEAS